MAYENPFHMVMRTKTNQKIKDEKSKKHYIQNVEDKLIHQTTHHTIPNMMDAYAKVQQTNHQPTTGEINYRQQTASLYIKH